ncbi:hypothetical protein HDE_12514 [Halotydeus destructor]|nr:hypothetical protein HDE_12514 [Halotydeus destructor]
MERAVFPVESTSAILYIVTILIIYIIIFSILVASNFTSSSSDSDSDSDIECQTFRTDDFEAEQFNFDCFSSAEALGTGTPVKCSMITLIKDKNRPELGSSSILDSDVYLEKLV